MLNSEQIKKLADNFKHKALAESEDDRTVASIIDADKLDGRIDILQEHESDYMEALATNDLKRVSKITDNLIDDNELGVFDRIGRFFQDVPFTA